MDDFKTSEFFGGAVVGLLLVAVSALGYTALPFIFKYSYALGAFFAGFGAFMGLYRLVTTAQQQGRVAVMASALMLYVPWAFGCWFMIAHYLRLRGRI